MEAYTDVEEVGSVDDRRSTLSYYTFIGTLVTGN